MAETMSRRSVNMVSKDSLRKSKKPLMEKRRRLRINTCLNQLKTLVLQALNKDGSHFSKLEKADILEMTVKYLRGVQRTQITGQVSANPTAQAAKYRAGFNECANEVVRYVHAVHGVNDEIRSRLMGHLANCMHVVNSPQEAPPTRAPLQPLYVQVPNGGVPQQNISSTVSAAAARQNMLLWGQQAELRALGPMVSVSPSGSSSPPFVSPYSQGSPVSRSPSPLSSIPSPSCSEMSSGSDMGSRLSPHSPSYHMPAKQELSMHYPQPLMPANSLKCKQEDVWRPW